MDTFTTLKSVLIPLPYKNIDTDQIIPARYLKVTDKESVAEGLFADWRFNPDGSAKEDFILNQPEYQDAKILLAGDNFGCGSSREHAPWAITGSGIQAVISTSFADIFKNNALKNGLLTIVVDDEMHQSLFDLVEEMPSAEVTVELQSQTIHLPDGSDYGFEIDAFAKKCLLTGKDQLEYILSFSGEIEAFEQTHSDFIIRS